MNTMKDMKIGELAKKSNTSIDTIRYYEKIGLLGKPSRSGAGYRLYSSEFIEQLKFIKRAKHVGFSIKEIQELLFLRQEKQVKTCADVKQFASKKLEDIEDKIVELTKIKMALDRIVKGCDGSSNSAAHCNILNALDSCHELE